MEQPWLDWFTITIIKVWMSDSFADLSVLQEGIITHVYTPILGCMLVNTVFIIIKFSYRNSSLIAVINTSLYCYSVNFRVCLDVVIIFQFLYCILNWFKTYLIFVKERKLLLFLKTFWWSSESYKLSYLRLVIIFACYRTSWSFQLTTSKRRCLVKEVPLAVKDILVRKFWVIRK